MEVLFVQTADPYHYYEMLLHTSRTVRSYCRRHDFPYECYIGVKRGYFAWHATFNRILIFKELLARGYSGWICYLDADAFIVNHRFDIEAYLADKGAYAAVMTPSGATGNWWDVNVGVMLLNAGSARARWLVDEWFAAFMKLSDEALRSASFFGVLPHDNDLLEDILRAHPDFRSSVYLESECFSLLALSRDNWDTGFAAQYLRAYAEDRGYAHDLGDRTAQIRRIVDDLMGTPGETGAATPELGERQRTLIVSALYMALLGRGADPSGLAAYAKVLGEEGLEYGLAKVLEAMLASDELAARMRRRFPTSGGLLPWRRQRRG